MYGNNKSGHWDETLQGNDRLRLIVNAMTRMRLVTADGAIDLKFKGRAGRCAAGAMRLFAAARRRSRTRRSSAATVGARAQAGCDRLCRLDSGLSVGWDLTALRLEDRQVLQVSCRAAAGTRRWQ